MIAHNAIKQKPTLKGLVFSWKEILVADKWLDSPSMGIEGINARVKFWR